MQTLQRLLDSLSRRLRCAVAIDDRPLQMLLHSSVYGRLDEARIHRMLSADRVPDPAVIEHLRAYTRPLEDVVTPRRIPAKPEIGFGERIYMPVRLEGEILGSLLVFDPDHLVGPRDMETIAEAAERAAAIIHRERQLWDPDRSRERDVLQAALSSDAGVRRRAVEELRDSRLLAPGPCFAMVAGLPDASEPWTRFDDIWEQSQPGHTLVAAIDTELWILSAINGADRAAAAGSFRRHLDDRAVIGLGDSREDVASIDVSLRHAREALQVGLATALPGSVVDWQDLGVYKLLMQVPESALCNTDGVSECRRLIEEHPVLAETLEAFLAHAGHSQRAASELFIHRATLHYRLKRIAEITGRDVDSGEDRLRLHLALKIARLMGGLRAAAS